MFRAKIMTNQIPDPNLKKLVTVMRYYLSTKKNNTLHAHEGTLSVQKLMTSGRAVSSLATIIAQQAQ